MPTENERKYVLFCEESVLYEIATKATEILSIEQAFVKEGSDWLFRIRKTEQSRLPEPTYLSTLKQQFPDRLLEINTVIDERDYYDLLGISLSKMYKTRYIIPFGSFKWEIDFFYEDLKRARFYFVQAEVELPEHVARPSMIPDFVANNLLFEVPIGNYDYSNQHLRNIEYAEARYSELLEDYLNGQKED